MNREDQNRIGQRPEQPLLDDLRAIGISLDSIWSDSATTKVFPPQAFRIILQHLRSAYPRRTREGMAAALARREARDVVWDDVLSLYRVETDDTGGTIKEALAWAIHVMARADDLKTLMELTRDPGNGNSRLFFVRNLARTKNPKAFELLYDLRFDQDLREEIGRVLKRRKAQLLVSPKTKHNASPTRQPHLIAAQT